MVVRKVKERPVRVSELIPTVAGSTQGGVSLYTFTRYCVKRTQSLSNYEHEQLNISSQKERVTEVPKRLHTVNIIAGKDERKVNRMSESLSFNHTIFVYLSLYIYMHALLETLPKV